MNTSIIYKLRHITLPRGRDGWNFLSLVLSIGSIRYKNSKSQYLLNDSVYSVHSSFIVSVLQCLVKTCNFGLPLTFL